MPTDKSLVLPLDDHATADIRVAYDSLDYDYAAYVQTHPDNLLTIAAMFGVDSPPLATARILEIGCGNGVNIIPLAERWPQARVMGCDLAERPIARGQAMISDLGLTNIELRAVDVRQLLAEDVEFDYVIAHGFYSWVPEPVREALFALLATRLSPQGLAFVSYNVLPGCYVRRIAFDAMNYHTRNATSAAEKLREARAVIRMMAEPNVTQNGRDALLQPELAAFEDRTDSELMHDDMAIPNEPCYFHEFMARAQRHELTYLGDAEVRMMTASGLRPGLRKLIAGMDRLEAEQYLDFARFRRFRRSLLTKAASVSSFAMIPARTASRHVMAASLIVKAMDAAEKDGKPRDAVLAGLEPSVHALLTWLLARIPMSASADEVARWCAQNIPTDRRKPDLLLAELYAAGLVTLYTDTPLTAALSGQPVASPAARRIAQEQAHVVNQRHESVYLADPHARRLLSLLDGSRDRDALVSAMGADYTRGLAGLDTMLQFFARSALLVA